MKKTELNRGTLLSRLAIAGLALTVGQSALALTSSKCDARLDVSITSSVRTADVADADCQDRSLTETEGFTLATSSTGNGQTVDSGAMVSAGGELYESFVSAARDAAVLLTPNRALMMSRELSGDSSGVDWEMGLLVQPVTSGSDTWINGTYTLLRTNNEVRIVDSVNQTDAFMSEVFDPVLLNVTFNGDSTCTVNSHSSWFGYSLTTDPAGAFSQPDGSNYGLHQAVYAGASSGQQHEDSNLTFNSCAYSLAADGELTVTYDYDDGDAANFVVDNVYFVSADLRYLVSTVNAAEDLYRGFEVGVRTNNVTRDADADIRNDAVAGTYLFNAPNLELQGSTGPLTEPDNENINNEKVTECMTRGSIELTTAEGVTADYNSCNVELTSTCSVRGEEGYGESTPAAGDGTVTISFSTAEGTETPSACEFQLTQAGDLAFNITQLTASGSVAVTYAGAMADNDEAIVLRGKYEGAAMPDPHDSNAPERTISADLLLVSLVGLKYEGTLASDADSDGLDNFGEFLFADYTSASPANDINGDGISDVVIRNTTGAWKVYNVTDLATAGTVQDTNIYSNTDYVFQGLADLDGDGTDDVLTRKTSDGAWNAFLMDDPVGNPNQASVSTVGLFAGSQWEFKGTPDVDSDGDNDVLLRNSSDGKWRLFIMDAGAVSSSGVPSLPYQSADWTFRGVGDFDGDGDDDVLERNTVANKWRVFYSDAGDITTTNTMDFMYTSAVIDFQSAGDADGDGDADILLRRNDNGRWLIHNFVSGVAESGGVTVANMFTNSDWTFASLADFDGDSDTDVLMRRTSDGLYRSFEIQDRDYTGTTNTLSIYSSSAWNIRTNY